MKKYFLILVLSLIYFFQLNLNAQGYIIHSSFSDDDGNPSKDADGVTNNEVIWSGGGTVHIVAFGYQVSANQTLKVQSNAIIKFTSEIKFDINGNTIFTPGGQMLLLDNAKLFMEGAMITDIRDDSEGGDTNQDGSASLPPDFSGSNLNTFIIAFQPYGGMVEGYIRKSKIKYAEINGLIPELTDNQFIMLKRIEFHSYYYNTDPSLVPVIVRNTFEFANELSLIDLRGAAPIIDGNTFKYVQGAKSRTTPGAAILIGPSTEGDKSVFKPTMGTTIISNNVFEIGGGIFLSPWSLKPEDESYALSLFHAEIRHNTFKGVVLPGDSRAYGRTCLTLDLRSFTKVTRNVFSNYEKFLWYSTNGIDTTYCGLSLNNNYFYRAGGPGLFPTFTLDKLWKNGIFIDVKSNYWDDPSGPNDFSGADGLQNRRGKGIILGDGYDYKPFIGGSNEPIQDDIHIKTEVLFPPPPIDIEPGMNVAIKVIADNYHLRSSDAGKIRTIVRDADGYSIGEFNVDIISSQDTSVTLSPVNFKVPEYIEYFTIEAELVPEGGLPTTISNQEMFEIKLPPPSIKVREIRNVFGPHLISGNSYKLKAVIEYSLSTSDPSKDGTIEVKIGEIKGFEYFPYNFGLPTVQSVASGNKKLTEIELDIQVPQITDSSILNENLAIPSERYVQFRVALKDETGNTVGVDWPNLGIKPGGKFSVECIPLIQIGNEIFDPQRDHFLIGEELTIGFFGDFNIYTKNVQNWQLRLIGIAFYDLSGMPFKEVYGQPAILFDNISTGFWNHFGAWNSHEIIPSETIAIGFVFALHDPISSKDITYDIALIEVRDIDYIVEMQIPTGDPEISFSPIPVTLDFSYNQDPGIATAEEYSGQFGSSAKSLSLAKTSGWYWDLIPLNRYWSVYDTLKENTFSANVSFTYDPNTDFPAITGFNEDSLVITGLNPLSNELEVLPSILDKTKHIITTKYDKFFDTYVVASKSTVISNISQQEIVPDYFALLQNYPNPFNPSTTIQYSLPEQSFVTIKLFDILGRQITTLVNQEKMAGNYKVEFDGSKLSTGVYFYRIQVYPKSRAGNPESSSGQVFIDTKKMILLK